MFTHSITPAVALMQLEALRITSGPPVKFHIILLRGLVANVITSAAGAVGGVVRLISVHLRSGGERDRGLI